MAYTAHAVWQSAQAQQQFSIGLAFSSSTICFSILNSVLAACGDDLKLQCVLPVRHLPAQMPGVHYWKLIGRQCDGITGIP